MSRPSFLIDPLLDDAARRPTQTALVFVAEDGRRTLLTSAELAARVEARARSLAALGVGAGDVLILVLGHSLDLVELFLGALRMGAAPCSFSYPTEKVDPAVYAMRVGAVVASAGARAVVTAPRFADALAPLVADHACRLVRSDALPAGAPHESPARPSSPHAIAFLQYTSGTTGAPKGVAHSHQRVLGYIEVKARSNAFMPGDVTVSWLPLYHDLGLVSGLLTPLVTGVTAVLMSPLHWVRDPKILLWAIHDFHGTHAWMPNFALSHCARAIRERDLDGLDLRHLKELVLGGEPVRPESMRVFLDRFTRYGFRAETLRAGYGMAEVVEAVTVTPAGRPPTIDWVRLHELHAEGRAAPAAADAQGSTSVVSCGAPMGGCEVAVVDAEGAALPDRRVGSVRVRSMHMATAYHRAPDLTAAAFRDGWFETGDLGYLADGELFVCGRRKDLIIVGGRNVYPEDLEGIADAVPGLQPGRSVAFGLFDERLGSERVVMVCELRDPAATDEERRRVEHELRRRLLAEQDVALGDLRLAPRGWVIKTSNGKLARTANRDKYLGERAGGPAPG